MEATVGNGTNITDFKGIYRALVKALSPVASHTSTPYYKQAIFQHNMIPFSPPYMDDEIIRAVAETLQSGWITTGPQSKLLEEEIAAYCNVECALAVNSGTSALMLVLHWLGVQQDDEVIIPAYTYCATALAVIHAGAKPVMVDSGTDFNIDPGKIAKAITSKTKAIIAVDFGGWPCDYDRINEVIENPKLKQLFIPCGDSQHHLGRILLISDAAHAIGAVYKNKPAGKCADITTFSLHAVKNVAAAEGGIVLFNLPFPFNNEQVCNTMRLWSLNGQTKDALAKTVSGSWEYDVVYPGFKMNMPDVLAVIGLMQFRKYKKKLLADRKRIFEFYNHFFSRHAWAICPPFQKDRCEPSYHLYPLRITGINEARRACIIERIAQSGVSVNVHFKPLPLLTVFKEAGYAIEAYPMAYKMYCNEISLPVYPQLTDEQCSMVTRAVMQSVAGVLETTSHEITQ